MDVKTGAYILSRSIADDVLHKLMARQDMSLHAIIAAEVHGTLVCLAEAQGWTNWPTLAGRDPLTPVSGRTSAG